MELPRLSRMSNSQTVRFTASGQTVCRVIVDVAMQLAAFRGGLKSRLVLLKCVRER